MRNESIAITQNSQQDYSPPQFSHLPPIATQFSHLPPIPTQFRKNSRFQLSFESNKEDIRKLIEAYPLISYSPQTHTYQTNKWEITSQRNGKNANIVIVSSMGTKRVGKSFILDSITSLLYGCNFREMSRSSGKNQFVRACVMELDVDCVMLDFKGGLEDEDAFLVGYFLGSVVLYQIANANVKEQEDRFLELLKCVQIKLESTPQQLPQPHLIFLVRDHQDTTALSPQFLHKIKQSSLFRQEIKIINIPYPGEAGIRQKQLIDVPQQKLSKSFKESLTKLISLITERNSKDKILKGNYLTRKMVGFLVEAVVDGMNRDRRLCVDKIWQNMIQNISISFYNHYLQLYQNALQTQFSSQNPWSKSSLHRKFCEIRLFINQRIEGYRILEDEKTFLEYKDKLNEVIDSKKHLITSINTDKCVEENKVYCRMLLKDINQDNCEDVIDRVCKSKLEDGLFQGFLDIFQGIIADRIKRMRKSNPDEVRNMQQNCRNLELQLQNIQNSIAKQEKVQSKIGALQNRQKSLEQKKLQLNTLKSQTQSQSSELQKKYYQLNEQKQRLLQQTSILKKKQEKQQNERKQTILKATKQSEQKLKSKKQTIRLLEDQLKSLKKVQTVTVQPTNKQKTCCCLLM